MAFLWFRISCALPYSFSKNQCFVHLHKNNELEVDIGGGPKILGLILNLNSNFYFIYLKYCTVGAPPPQPNIS